MNLHEKLDAVKTSEIFRLNWQGKTIGLRVKYFDINSETYYYYDFSLDYIKDSGIRKFLTGENRDFKVLNLVQQGDLLATSDEIAGVVTPREFKDDAHVMRVMSAVQKIYRFREEAA